VTDPEQLFAMAYSTCFLSALGATHANLNKGSKPLGKDTQVRAHVSIGKPTNGLPVSSLN
jgi:organic hydroperoxide reductase OsmC/OhrA